MSKSELNGRKGTRDPFLTARIGTRITEAAKLVGGKKTLAETIGLSESQLHRIVNGESTAKIDTVTAIADAAGVSLEWLVIGTGSMRPQSILDEAPCAADQIREVSIQQYGRRDDDSYAYIPLYEVRAAAGHGSIINGERAIDALAFKHRWIRDELLANPADLYLIKVDGESMEPALRSGDVILVNHRDNTVQRDGIYVLRMDDALLVKRLQTLPDGRLRASSDNPAYQPFDIDRERLGEDAVSIIGRVVWTGRRI